MKKTILITAVALFTSLLSHLNAQSINNKDWRAYLDAPISDTVTFHIHSDSSFVTNSNGEVVIRIRCTVSGDTLTIVNQDAEQHGCPDQMGKYKIETTNDSFTLTQIEDECEGRSRALQGVKWKLVRK